MARIGKFRISSAENSNKSAPYLREIGKNPQHSCGFLDILCAERHMYERPP